MVRGGSLSGGLCDGIQPDELFDTIVETPGMRIERIVSTGQVTPKGEWYDQDRDEFVLLVTGSARLLIEGEDDERLLGPGDWLLLPAHCRHRVTWTQGLPPTIWLGVHYASAP
ncbi:MAG: cupin [Pseudomonadota bacterium]